MRRAAIGIFILLLGLTIIPVVADQRPGDCTGLCALVWSPADAYLLGAVDQFGLWLYDTNQSDSAPQLFPKPYATSLSFDPLGHYVAVLSCPDFITAAPNDSCQGLLSLFDLKTRSWKQIRAFNFPVSNVKFTPDGRYVVFQKDEPRAWGIQLIDLATNETFSIVDHTRNRTNLVIDYAFDPQSNYIAISNGSIAYELEGFLGLSVWRLSDQTLRASTQGNILAANLAFTENDAAVIFVQYDTQVSVWNYQTGVVAPLKTITKTSFDNLHDLSFSDPPTYLVAALTNNGHLADRTLFAWNLQSGEKIFYRDTPEDSFTELIAMNSTADTIAYSSTVDPRRLITIWERSTDSTRTVTMTTEGTS